MLKYHCNASANQSGGSGSVTANQESVSIPIDRDEERHLRIPRLPGGINQCHSFSDSAVMDEKGDEG